jgi:hypothetical protein
MINFSSCIRIETKRGRNMRKKIILYAAVLMLMFIGCNNKTDNIVTPEPVQYDTLIPLHIGNYWIYKGIYLNNDGSEKDMAITYKNGFVIDDTVTQVINGKGTLCYKMFSCEEDAKPFYDKPGSFEGSKLIYQNASGMYYAGTERYDTIKTKFNYLLFPYPANAEDTISCPVFYYSPSGNYFSVSDEEMTKCTCVSTDSTFTTPLGDFHCVVYKIAYYDLEPLFRDDVYYFVKPGLGIVGMVQMVYHYNSKEYNYFMKYVLTNYKTN